MSVPMSYSPEHTLVIESYEDGLVNYYVRHPEECPSYTVAIDPDEHPIIEYDCLVSFVLDGCGSDSFNNEESWLIPGEYKIRGWSSYENTWISGEVYDSGIEILSKQNGDSK